jgi:Tetratricopeptide repeat
MEAYSSIHSCSSDTIKDIHVSLAASIDRRSGRSDLLKRIIERRSAQKAYFPFEMKNDTACSFTYEFSFENIPPVSTATPSCDEEENADELTFSLRGEKGTTALSNRLAALHAQQRIFGESHPDVIFALRSLAALYCRHGEYSEAQKIYIESYRRVEDLKKESIPSEILITSNSNMLIENTTKFY